MFESLESRRLLSASANLADGSHVRIHGHDKLDIDGKGASNNLVITENQGVVDIHDLYNDEWTTYDGVKSIKIKGGAGNDTILYRGTSIGADISGGSGSDYITILDAGDASSTVDAGAGNDNIVVVFSHRAVIKAGSGNDVININTGNYGAGYAQYDYSDTNVTVDAGSGDDVMYIYAGRANVDGGSGEDRFTDLSGGLASFSLKKIETVL